MLCRFRSGHPAMSFDQICSTALVRSRWLLFRAGAHYRGQCFATNRIAFHAGLYRLARCSHALAAARRNINSNGFNPI